MIYELSCWGVDLDDVTVSMSVYASEYTYMLEPIFISL